MSADTDLILDRINQLSVEELLLVRAKIDEKIGEEKEALNQPVRFSEPKRKLIIPGAYQRTSEEIEAELAEVFTPEERAEMAKVDLNHLPTLPAGAKTSAQLISEDREDRF